MENKEPNYKLDLVNKLYHNRGWTYGGSIGLHQWLLAVIRFKDDLVRESNELGNPTPAENDILRLTAISKVMEISDEFGTITKPV